MNRRRREATAWRARTDVKNSRNGNQETPFVLFRVFRGPICFSVRLQPRSMMLQSGASGLPRRLRGAH